MSHAFILAGVALANMLGVISPGPAFLLVTRAAAGRSQSVGLATGFGVAAASLLWAVAATFGVAALMTRFARVYAAIQMAGGIYLIWLGLSAWRRPGAAAEPTGTAPTGVGRAVLNGFLLTLGNPKVVVFFGSIFVALFPVDTPLWVRIAAVGIVAVQETLWYALVALLFSHPRVRAGYHRVRDTIELVMGAVFVGLGARLVALARL